MLSDNIRIYRKENNMSQDELAEKLGVSRQSISLWETGQSQPTIENIIALTKIFNVSTDAILGNKDNASAVNCNLPEKAPTEKKKTKIGIILVCIVAALCIIGGVIWFALFKNNDSNKANSDSSSITDNTSASQSKSSTANAATVKAGSKIGTTNKADTNSKSESSSAQQTTESVREFDIFTYCKDFAIKKGTLNGDYSIYQQPATLYGGNKDEYFSISYWADSNMVEFCLHCPLNDTYSENFYLRMRGGFDKKYEYLSSRYYRDNGESIKSATGY